MAPSSATCDADPLSNPLIGHLKFEGHLGRCYLKGRDGDAANVILSAVDYNFGHILAWLRFLFGFILSALIAATRAHSPRLLFKHVKFVSRQRGDQAAHP